MLSEQTFAQLRMGFSLLSRTTYVTQQLKHFNLDHCKHVKEVYRGSTSYSDCK